MILKATKPISGVTFTIPRMSRLAIREMWIERFINSMLMDEEGNTPLAEWSLVEPDNCPDEIEFLPAHFDVMVIRSDDEELLTEKYHAYRNFMAREYGDYAELEIDEFLPSEPFIYTTEQMDIKYTEQDDSPREALYPLYEEVDDSDEEGNEEIDNDAQ